MLKAFTTGSMLCALLVAGTSAQTKKPAKAVTHDVTIRTADSAVYTGTVDLSIEKGKVSGDMLIVSPTTITGKVAGTAEAGVLKLDFPYQMTENKCDGTVKMQLTMPPKTGPIKGTMEAVGCGRDASQKLTGTVEMTPQKK